MPLDLRVRLILWLGKRAGRSFRPDVTVQQMRAGYAELNRRCGIQGERGVRVRDVTIPAEDGTPIPARFYEPPGVTAPLPLIVYFHGGGFVIGDVAAYDGFARFLAVESACAVLSVDYRLGPEYRFPQAHRDAFTALAWAQANGAGLGTDPRRIAVAGDSAGGGLAAMLAAFAPKRPDFQLLIYPSVDGTASFPSRTRFTDGLPLTPATIAWFTEHFAASPADRDGAWLSPLAAPNPERLPPTYVLAAGYDPLVDEGRAYADRARAAGVPVTYDLRASLPHALLNLAGAVPAARRALRTAARATGAALRDTVIDGAGAS